MVKVTVLSLWFKGTVLRLWWFKRTALSLWFKGTALSVISNDPFNAKKGDAQFIGTHQTYDCSVTETSVYNNKPDPLLVSFQNNKYSTGFKLLRTRFSAYSLYKEMV